MEQGRNFNNKLWNALKLVQMWGDNLTPVSSPASQSDPGFFATHWFENRLNQARTDIEKLFNEFRISEALKTIYSLVWDDFCSWYLEWVKPGFGKSIHPAFYDKTIGFFEDLLQLLHPFMPFMTEEIYHLLREHAAGDDLCIKPSVPELPFDSSLLRTAETLRLFLTVSREFRQQHQLKNSEPIPRLILTRDIFGEKESLYAIIVKQLNIANLEFSQESLTAGRDLQVIPFQSYQLGFESPRKQDNAKRKEELEKELYYYRGFLETLNKKLTNERFVQNAKPEVINLEKKKKSDTEEKIAAILLTLGS
jgi:valyl-tRNA synthetase